MRTKTLWIKDDYLRMILDGRKTVDVRVGYSNILRLQPGDRLMLNEKYPFRIKQIRRYEGFDELIEHEEPDAIAPGYSKEALLRALHEIYPPEKEKLGAVALEIEKMEP